MKTVFKKYFVFSINSFKIRIMNLNKMLKTKEEIIEWLDKYGVKNYSVNEDLTVDVEGSVNLSHKNLKNIPIKFNIVKGDFYCNNNLIESLKGCPKEVGRDFDCYSNRLNSLIGGPIIVRDSYDCSNNRLKNLIGSPKIINKNFNCSLNFLNTLEGCPDEIDGVLECSSNAIEDLEFFPKRVGRSHIIDSVNFSSNEGLGELQDIVDFKELLKNHEKIKILKYKNLLEKSLRINPIKENKEIIKIKV